MAFSTTLMARQTPRNPRPRRRGSTKRAATTTPLAGQNAELVSLSRQKATPTNTSAV